MDLDDILARYDPGVRRLALAARAALLAELPGIGEEVDPSSNVVGYGYAPGYKGLICTIILARTGVKLGFSHGASLHDPQGLLAGSGKVHRFIELRSEADAERPALRRLLAAAKAAYEARRATASAAPSR